MSAPIRYPPTPWPALLDEHEKHPWYGPCDALGPDGQCAECLNETDWETLAGDHDALVMDRQTLARDGLAHLDLLAVGGTVATFPKRERLRWGLIVMICAFIAALGGVAWAAHLAR